MTPSARYDFKFKDYAPWVFRDLREEHFHLDPADYLLSLTAKYILSELGSPGKSGSFFYFSRDYRFIIKTIAHSEHKFLRSILRDYHQHVINNPHTLLSRFYGLHRVKLPRGRKIHFVIMNNLFPPHYDIHETYDLKGSAYGREYPEDKAKTNPKAVLKDINWVNRGRILEFGPEKQALFAEQLRRDTEFLKRIKVMDYSLLVGIHNMERGNRDNLREKQLSVFHVSFARDVADVARHEEYRQGHAQDGPTFGSQGARRCRAARFRGKATLFVLPRRGRPARDRRGESAPGHYLLSWDYRHLHAIQYSQAARALLEEHDGRSKLHGMTELTQVYHILRRPIDLWPTIPKLFTEHYARRRRFFTTPGLDVVIVPACPTVLHPRCNIP